MPSLIRFLVVLGVIAGLVFGSMVALTIFVAPSEKEVVVTIPSRDLFEEKSFFSTTNGADQTGVIKQDEVSGLFEQDKD